MRSIFPFSMRAGVIGLLGAVLALSGCGGDPPRTDRQLEQDAKVQALLKEGKSISQIRSNIKGDPDPKTVKKKKTVRKK
jgi:hypothetical protein